MVRQGPRERATPTDLAAGWPDFTQQGVTNPEAGAGTFFKAEPGEDIWDCIRRQTPWLDAGQTEGHFHPTTLAQKCS